MKIFWLYLLGLAVNLLVNPSGSMAILYFVVGVGLVLAAQAIILLFGGRDAFRTNLLRMQVWEILNTQQKMKSVWSLLLQQLTFLGSAAGICAFGYYIFFLWAELLRRTIE